MFAPAYFLSTLLALANLMRLSLTKAAHVGLGGASCRKSGYMGRERYISIALPGPSSDFLVNIVKTVVGLRPVFSAQVRFGEGHPSSSY